MSPQIRQIGWSLGSAASLWLVVGWWRLWLLGLILVVGVELVRARYRLQEIDWARLAVELAAVLVLYSYPVSVLWKLVIAGLYGLWLWWQTNDEQVLPLRALAAQALVMEAIYVWVATAGGDRTVATILVWCGSLAIARDWIRQSAPELASILATTWALVAAELGWVLSAWLVVYVVRGQGVLIPQPALVTTGIAYCFGSIYLAQRQGKLSYWRLVEYVAVGVIIMLIVVLGTNWRATI